MAFVTIGEKRVAGARTGQRSLVVYVSKKGRVPAAEKVPKRVSVAVSRNRSQVVPTDVVELAGEPQAFGVRSGHILRAADGDMGICCLGFRQNGRDYVATNAHVVGNILRRRVQGDPSVQDRETLQFLPMGPVVYISDFPPRGVIEEDLAVVRSDQIVVDQLGILDEAARIKGFGSFTGAMSARYWYSVNGAKMFCAHPEPLPAGHTAAILVDGIRLPYANFWTLQVVQGVAMPGHSGALLCRGSGGGIVACGIVFGGASPNFVFAFSLEPGLSRARSLLP